MKNVWLKRGDRYEAVRLLCEYPEVGAVKVLRARSPEPWTVRASDIVTEKPLTKLQRERIIKRKVLEELEAAQKEQIKDVLFDGQPKSIMEIVYAVNAMPMSNPKLRTRMEPARAWKIVRGFVKQNTHTAERKVTNQNRKHWIVQRSAPQPL